MPDALREEAAREIFERWISQAGDFQWSICALNIRVAARETQDLVLVGAKGLNAAGAKTGIVLPDALFDLMAAA